MVCTITDEAKSLNKGEEMNTFRPESDRPKYDAQRNLCGRTHYVDDDTLRYHKSRVLLTATTDNGLLFGLVESVALDPNNTRRGFRAVVFDVFGTVLTRSKLEDSRKTREAARKDMWEALNNTDAKAHTLKAIADHRASYTAEMDRLEASIK